MLVALCSVLLYHLVNPALLQLRHQPSDAVEVLLFLVVGFVTTSLAKDAARMRRLAHTDDLTGLHNLRSFEAHLGKLLETGERHPFTISLLVLDLDRLKGINDAHGHLAGAEAVRLVGETIARHVPPEALPCRYGGDEFVIALPKRDLGQAVTIGEALRLAVNEQEPILAGHRLPAGALSISAGVASLVITAATAAKAGARLGEELFREADRALYLAKGEGRNRVHGIEARLAERLPGAAPTSLLAGGQRIG